MFLRQIFLVDFVNACSNYIFTTPFNYKTTPATKVLSWSTKLGFKSVLVKNLSSYISHNATSPRLDIYFKSYREHWAYILQDEQGIISWLVNYLCNNGIYLLFILINIEECVCFNKIAITKKNNLTTTFVRSLNNYWTLRSYPILMENRRKIEDNRIKTRWRKWWRQSRD